MSATIYDLVWSGNQSTPFLFNPVIDGNVYFCKVYLLNDRAFIEIGTGNNGFLGVQPLVGSCDCGDIQLFPQLGFTDNFVYRESGQHFEVGGVKKSCPEFVPYAPSPPAWVCYPELNTSILSDNSFVIDGIDLTDVFVVGVYVSFTGVDTGTVYGTVVSSALDGGTLVTLAMDGTSSLNDVNGETAFVVCRVSEQIYITADLTDIHGVFDPDFVDDNIVTFTLHAANAANGDIYQWRLVGGDPDNFCPWVSSGDLTISGGIASCTVHAANGYDFPPRNTPFIIIVSQSDVDLCSSPVVSNWAWYGCGS